MRHATDPPARSASGATRTVAAVALSVALGPAPRALRAQTADARPAPIQDNSFLLEEAYNQDVRMVQHIATFTRPRTGRDWAFSFTEEWPAGGRRHQLSYTIPVLQPGGAAPARAGVGDVALNYRYQLAGMHGGPAALAPRLTVLLPTGSARDGTGAGGAAVQASLPLSVVLSERFVTHLNAGVTLTPRARDADGATARTTAYNVGQSFVWLAAHRVNGLLELAWTRAEVVAGPGAVAAQSQLLVSPGVRWSYDLVHDTQIVPGVALPIGVGPSRGSQFAFLYFSVEHPF